MNDFVRALQDAERDAFSNGDSDAASERVRRRLREPRRRPVAWRRPTLTLALAASFVLGGVVAVLVVAEPAPQPVLYRDAMIDVDRERLAGPTSVPSVGVRAPASPSIAPSATTEPEGALVAIAIGGSCHFRVDGKYHGNKSSLRVKVKVGSHVVSCSGGGKGVEQTVMVTEDEPAIATFKNVDDEWTSPSQLDPYRYQ